MKKLIVISLAIIVVVGLFYIAWRASSYPTHEATASAESTEGTALETILPQATEAVESTVPPTPSPTITPMPEPTLEPTPMPIPDIFLSSEIPADVQDFMWGKTIRKDSLVTFDDLRYLTITYWGFDDQKHVGNLIVNKQISDDVLEIFKVLLENKFPIEKMVLPDYYDGIDELSMEDDNTSAFNDRPIEGSGALSWHQLGLAIDINPFVNPCFHPNSKIIEPTGTERFLIEPAGTEKFLDRTLDQPGLIKEGDACYKAFTSRGWDWGGSWNDPDPKDYMHFQKLKKLPS